LALTISSPAFENGAEFIVRCRAQRILTADRRAAGVEAVYTGDDGTEQRRVVVKAPRVVVACGALESPALLLRSGIGGPAAHLAERDAALPTGELFALVRDDRAQDPPRLRPRVPAVPHGPVTLPESSIATVATARYANFVLSRSASSLA